MSYLPQYHLIAYEKYFTVMSPDSIQEYTKLQKTKLVILYSLFIEKYKEQQDKVSLSFIHICIF